MPHYIKVPHELMLEVRDALRFAHESEGAKREAIVKLGGLPGRTNRRQYGEILRQVLELLGDASTDDTPRFAYTPPPMQALGPHGTLKDMPAVQVTEITPDPDRDKRSR